MILIMMGTDNMSESIDSQRDRKDQNESKYPKFLCQITLNK